MLTFDPAALPLRDKAAQVRSAPDGEQSCRATLRRDSIPGSEQNLAGCTDASWIWQEHCVGRSFAAASASVPNFFVHCLASGIEAIRALWAQRRARR